MDTAERRPRLGRDPALCVERAQRLLREERMQRDLVHRRHYLGPPHQVVEMLLAEVRDADCAGASLREHLLNRLVCGDCPVEVGGHGLVKQEEVDVVEAEASEAAVEAAQRFVIAVVADP